MHLWFIRPRTYYFWCVQIHYEGKWEGIGRKPRLFWALWNGLWHRAVRRVPFRAQKSREIISTVQPVHFHLICLSLQTFIKRYRYLSTCLILLSKQYCSLPLLSTMCRILIVLRKLSFCWSVHDVFWQCTTDEIFLTTAIKLQKHGALRKELLIEF